jgi:hypothetical protein
MLSDEYQGGMGRGAAAAPPTDQQDTTSRVTGRIPVRGLISTVVEPETVEDIASNRRHQEIIAASSS